MRKLSKEFLARKVKETRMRHGYSQEKLGELTGINRQVIGRMESGEVTPSIKQLENLAEALGFEISDLYENQTPMVRTAFRRHSDNWEKEEGVERLLEMMMTSKQQILLREAMDNE